MVTVRPSHHGFDRPGGGARHPGAPSSRGEGGRLNLLLSYAGWQSDSWADHLPRLLEPFGVSAWRAGSAHEATTLIRRMPVHIAVVDLSIPLDSTAAERESIEAGGLRVLDLLARHGDPVPTVVVNRRRTRREESRQLERALEAGVFAVLEPPVRVETALEVMRRVLRRHYADRWPTCCNGGTDQNGESVGSGGSGGGTDHTEQTRDPEGDR